MNSTDATESVLAASFLRIITPEQAADRLAGSVVLQRRQLFCTSVFT